MEGNITGSTNAPLTGAAFSSHYTGIASTKLAARVGGSMRIDENIYDVLSEDKNFSDAACDIAEDGIKTADEDG